MTEWPKVHDWKSCVRASVPRVRIPLSPLAFATLRLSGERRLIGQVGCARRTRRAGRIPLSPLVISNRSQGDGSTEEEGKAAAVCTSVCTPPPDEAILKAAIDRLTAALVTADDATIAGLVAERAELRAELRARSDVVSLDEERARRDR
jgi:hypothetical protein